MSSYPTGAPFVVGSDTSYAAAASLSEDTLSRLEGLVLDFVRSKGEKGATDDEMDAWVHSLNDPNLSPVTLRPRRRSLVLKGLLRDSGDRRQTRKERLAAVWVIGKSDEAGPEEKAKQPSKDQLKQAVSEILQLIQDAKSRSDFKPSDDLRSVWVWLRDLSNR